MCKSGSCKLHAYGSWDKISPFVLCLVVAFILQVCMGGGLYCLRNLGENRVFEMASLKDPVVLEVLKEIDEYSVAAMERPLHPSECQNRDIHTAVPTKKILKSKHLVYLDFINDYHSYCKLCQHHFYSSSKLNDINSFFQNHMNSVHHVWNKINSSYQLNRPIFTWEKWLYTGFCNICKISNIEAFILENEFGIIDIVKDHIKGNMHTDRFALINTKPLWRILPTLNLFANLCIRKISSHRYFCELCAVLIDKEALLENHKVSIDHGKKFAQFIKNKYNLSLNEASTVLVIENLVHEVVKDTHGMQEPTQLFESTKTRACLDSSIEELIINPFKDISMKVLGFSPKVIEGLLSLKDEDFCSESGCLLCNESFSDMDRHLASNSHQLRVLIFERCSSVGHVPHPRYLSNRLLRLSEYNYEIAKYYSYKALLHKHGLDFGIEFKPEFLDLVLKEENSTVGDNVETVGEKSTLSASKTVASNMERSQLYNDGNSQVEKSANKKPKKKTDGNIRKTKNENRKTWWLAPKKNPMPSCKTDETGNYSKADNVKIVNFEVENVNIEWVANFSQNCKSVNLKENFKNYCTTCLSVVHESKMNVHVQEERHQMALKEKADNLKLLQDDTFKNLIKKIRFLNLSFFVCVACSVKVSGSDNIALHVKGRYHVQKFESIKKRYIEPVSFSNYNFNSEVGTFVCKPCGSIVYKTKQQLIWNDMMIDPVIREIRLHRANCNQVKAAKKSNGASSVDSKKEVSTALKSREVSYSDKQGHCSEKSSSEIQKVIATCSNDRKTNSDEEQAKEAGKIRVENKSVDTTSKNGNQLAQEPVEVDNNAASKTGANDLGLYEEADDRNRPALKDNDKEGNANGPVNMPRMWAKKLRAKKFTLKQSLMTKELNKMLTDCGPVAEGFLCMICLVSDGLDQVKEHLESQSHLSNELFILSYAKVTCEFCDPCKIILLGTEDMSRQHLDSMYHVKAEKQKSGQGILPRPIGPRSQEILVIKGLPDIPNNQKKKIIMHLLAIFGDITLLHIKHHVAEVAFANSEVIKEIVKTGSVIIGNFKLRFSVKRITEDVRYLMKPGMIYLLSHCNHLMNFISQLVNVSNNVRFSPEIEEKENRVCGSLVECISRVYPKCKCFKFGSRPAGLTLDGSDLDIFIDCGGMYFGEICQDPLDQAVIVKKVVQILKQSQEFANVMGIARTRVPIVTCLHRSTNIECDVSFKNGLSCENTTLVSYMISLDERVKGLVLFLKAWVKILGLHGRPSFSSYALTMLAFYYLQQGPNPVLPTIEYLQKCYTGPRKTIAGWDCSFSMNKEDVPKTNNKDSLPQLILGFFNFCIDFSFIENIVSPLTGKPLKREDVRNMAVENLEPNNKQKSKLNGAYYCSVDEPICIMDPFDLNHNLTKCFPKLSFKLFIYFCCVSANVLSSALKSKVFCHLY